MPLFSLGAIMSSALFAWIIANKEWCFSALCAVFGGAFAFVKWILPLLRKQKTIDTHPNFNISANGTGNSLAVIDNGANVVGGVITGSHNVQTVVINQSLQQVEKNISIRSRKSSIPTGNEIRQKRERVLKDIPLYLQDKVLNDYLRGYLNLRVEWPIRIWGISKLEKGGEELLRLDARYGEEDWGACIQIDVKASDYPILRTLDAGHRAFVNGHITHIDDYRMRIEASALDFE
jgi:hypothetical protein